MRQSFKLLFASILAVASLVFSTPALANYDPGPAVSATQAYTHIAPVFAVAAPELKATKTAQAVAATEADHSAMPVLDRDQRPAMRSLATEKRHPGHGEIPLRRMWLT